MKLKKSGEIMEGNGEKTPGTFSGSHFLVRISDPAGEFTEDMMVVTQHERKPVKGRSKRKTIKVTNSGLTSGGPIQEPYYLNEK